MSVQTDSDASTLGRGRGRGARNEGSEMRECIGVTSSGKRTSEGNGSGAKRGTTRDHRPITLYKTKPTSAENSKMGCSGKPLKLTANYFNLCKRPSFEIMQYRVDFQPELEVLAIRKAFIGKHREILGGYIYDGGNSLFLTRRLPQEVYDFHVESRENVSYKMTIKNTANVISMTDDMATQILNLILRRSMDGLELQLVGRNLFDAKNKVRLPDYKLELWPGYITSIRQHEENILLCCEISHKVMRDETAYDILQNCLRNSGRESFMKEIVGTTVLTDYNNRTYRVDDVDWKTTADNKFKLKDREISFIEYYKEKYNLQIRDRRQPMLVSRPKARDIRGGRAEILLLIPELCRVTGLNDQMRNNFNMMRGMADHTRMDPEKRTKRLLDFNRRLLNTPVSLEVLTRFETELEPKLIEFQGRQLNQETMLYGNNATSINDDRNVDWTNFMKLNEMYASVPLKRWGIIYPRRNERETLDFLKLMEEVARGMRYEMGKPKLIEILDDRSQTYTKALSDFISIDPRLIMVVVPNNSADRYALVKKLTCVNKAIPSQVIVSKTMMPKKGGMGGVKSIATKVIIQLNCKLGGAAWMIKFPMSGVMTIGFDVTHDTSDRSKSYGAFVASMDIKKTNKYFSAVSAHSNGEEMSNNISTHLQKAMREYREEHGSLPKCVLFYRDGVGDGQIEYVHGMEVQQLSSKLKEIYCQAGITEEPKLCFVIVNKRINTRIFAQSNGRPENPKSGTVVDNTITLPERYDFYLVSQSVRQGTVSPTSYNVVHDTMGLSPDRLQLLTYKLCHLYYNWSGTTRVPAVVQYAHKLALLVGQYLHQAPSSSFDKQLYFL